MKIITCETWGELKVGVPISSDMRGRFLSLSNEETSRANLKDYNPAYLDYYNAWIDELSKQQILSVQGLLVAPYSAGHD